MGTLENLFRASGFSKADQLVIREWLAAQLEAQVHAKLEQGGHTVNQIPLRRVFVDLPVSGPHSTTSEGERTYFLKALLSEPPLNLSTACTDVHASDSPLFARMSADSPAQLKKLQSTSSEKGRNFSANILIGGPGQGKSTLSQLASQIHRAALLKPFLSELSLPQAELVKSFDVQNLSDSERLWPDNALFPLQVTLPDLANWLAKIPSEPRDETATPQILLFIAQLASSKNVKLNSGLLRHAAQYSPLLLVFDGFDEVGASEDRQRIVSAIQELIFWLAARDAKAQIIATTRPQGYSGELARVGVELSEHYLIPLLQSEALGYAKKLFNAKITDPDDRLKMLTRIQEAASDPSTARLLTTPLQVTILAALVQQIGRAPRERWKLFARYFSYTYDREIERDTYASSLLAVYKPQIERIHARVGLMLQIEAERDGGASARMPRDRLIEVINAVLVEDEFSVEDQQQLAHDIAIAAEHRLVFIVEPEPNSYGFEIRSLQEFMAAWAITEGRDSEVEKRVRLIANAAIFRNVMLFITSRLYSEAIPLRDDIAKICLSIDEEYQQNSEIDLHSGAILALEILEEGSVHTQPKRARALMEKAVKILELPIFSLSVRLAIVPTGDTRATVLSAIVSALESGRQPASRNAWLALLRFTFDSDPTANVIFCKYWADLADPSTILFDCQNEGVPFSALVFQKIEERALAIDAKSLFNPHTPVATKPTLWSQWMHAVLTEKAWLTGGEFIAGNQLNDEDLPLPPEPNDPIPNNWKIQYCWMKFEHRPSHSALADLVDAYSDFGQSDQMIQDQWQQSWPIRAIIQGGIGKAYLNDVSIRLRKGLLGNVELWRAAQKNWNETKLTNLFGPNWDSMPWDAKRLLRVPPVILIPIWKFPREKEFNSVAEYKSFVAQFNLTSNSSVKIWIAAQAVFFIRIMRGTYQVALKELTAFLDVAPQNLAMLLPRPKAIRAKDWHLIVDQYSAGLEGGWLMPPEFMLNGYTKKGTSLALLRAAARAISEDYHGLGVIEKMREFLATTLKKIPLENEKQCLYVWLLELYAGVLDENHDAELVNLVRTYSESEPWLRSSLTYAVQKGKVPAERSERILKATLSIVIDDRVVASLCMSALHSITGAKKTYIETPSIWSRLGFGLPMPNASGNLSTSQRRSSNIVRIKEIEITNIGRIETLKLQFPEPKLNSGQWIVLLGQNGAGKSTILRSIVVGLRDVKEPSIWPNRTFTREWIRVANDGTSAEGKIRIAIEDFSVTTHVTPATPPAFQQQPEFIEPLPIPIFAYGCRRGSATGGASRDVDLAEGMEIATLMDDAASLIHAETWLKDLDGDASKHIRAAEFYKNVLSALCQLLDLKSISVANRRVWVTMEGSAPIPFSELSDGYLTSAGWFVDLIARWTNYQESRGYVLDENFMAQMTGLVLIDELDLHLHPKWQVEIIGKTKKLLPKMSFVVTTHNPLTLVGADANEIWHLEIDDSQVAVTQGVEPPLLLTGGQLYRRYFGIHDIYPSEIGRSMQRLAFLSGMPRHTPEELVEISLHRKVVETAGIPIDEDEFGGQVAAS